MVWDGKDRRANPTDHDLLTEIHGDVKYIRKDFGEHKLEDTNRFKILNDKVDWTQKVLYMGLGALALLKLFLK